MPFVPEKPGELEAQKQRILRMVAMLRQEIQELQDSIDRMVFGLYGVKQNQMHYDREFKHNASESETA